MRITKISVLLAISALCCKCGNTGKNIIADSGVVPIADGTKPADDGKHTLTEGGTPVEATVYDITSGKIPEGQAVVLRDIIVTAADGYGKYTGDLYVQEIKGGAGSGIKLFAPQRTDGEGQITDLVPGDHVRAEGVVKCFEPTGGFNDKRHPNKKCVLELDKGCQVARLSSGTPPIPTEVTAKQLLDDPTASTWENVLVTVKNVSVTAEVNPEYGEFKVSDDISVDDELFPNTVKLNDCLSITGVSIYFFNYKLLPRSDLDITAGQGCPKPTVLSIKDIQNLQSPKHPQVGSVVTVNGVITAVDSTLSSETQPRYIGFWLQDEGGGPQSGIYIYYFWDDATPAAKKPTLGDRVVLNGTYDEYKPSSSSSETVTELKNVSWASQGPAAKMPEPEPVDAEKLASGKAKEFEGVMVKVENVEVSGYSMTTGTPPKKVGLKLKNSNLLVEVELFYFMNPEPPVGTLYKAIVGPVHYTYGNFKILPRMASDLQK